VARYIREGILGAAQEICLAAMDNRTSHEQARMAFIAAAQEASITID